MLPSSSPGISIMRFVCPCVPNRDRRRTAPITDAEDKKGDRVEFAEKSRSMDEEEGGDREVTAGNDIKLNESLRQISWHLT